MRPMCIICDRRRLAWWWLISGTIRGSRLGLEGSWGGGLEQALQSVVAAK
jgi:hypothetical protein